jgi:hypothetical protein
MQTPTTAAPIVTASLAQIAELEAAIVRAVRYLRDDMPRTALNILDGANA